MLMGEDNLTYMVTNAKSNLVYRDEFGYLNIII